MRKTIRLNVAVVVFVMVFTIGTAFAGNTATGNQAPSGPHFNINIIGHPKGSIGGDDSSGHSIMIPLKNVQPGVPITCVDVNGVVLIDDKGLTPTVEPTGARIYFVSGDHFEIIDRDATDSNGATIMVPVGAPDPVTGDKAIAFDVYIRVLGKPNQCMKIDAFVTDATDADQTVWYQTGTLKVSRKTGQSIFVRVNELFTICIWDAIQQKCVDYRSVFNDIFDSYFWSILNDGTRLVQLRLYPK